jgi:hypothetical protein
MSRRCDSPATLLLPAQPPTHKGPYALGRGGRGPRLPQPVPIQHTHLHWLRILLKHVLQRLACCGLCRGEGSGVPRRERQLDLVGLARGARCGVGVGADTDRRVCGCDLAACSGRGPRHARQEGWSRAARQHRAVCHEPLNGTLRRLHWPHGRPRMLSIPAHAHSRPANEAPLRSLIGKVHGCAPTPPPRPHKPTLARGSARSPSPMCVYKTCVLLSGPEKRSCGAPGPAAGGARRSEACVPAPIKPRGHAQLYCDSPHSAPPHQSHVQRPCAPSLTMWALTMD